MEFINPTTTFNFAYPQEYWSRIQIYQLAEYGAGNTTRYKDPTTKLKQTVLETDGVEAYRVEAYRF
jgi:hypothetical protein